EHGKGKLLETMVEIQDHYDVAKEMEISLLELHQVFLNMVMMVETQGEKKDDIEHHVINAAHYVNDGTKNLKMMYRFTKNILHQMWNDVRLLVDYEVEMAYDLLRLIMRRIAEIDADEDLSLINEIAQDQGRMNDQDMFGVSDLDGDEVVVDVSAGEKEE
nr:syntaxin-related protein KNOLLE [Tanacetum cinerariifolium]